jgi:SAM-dependent methyltransferase
VVAGQAIRSNAGGFRLWHCRRCGFAQKWPQPTRAELHQAYGCSNERCSAGAPGAGRPLWHQLEGLAQRYSPSNLVLDVGCSNGDLLGSWSGRWRRHGVELSSNAAAIAARRGVSIVGQTMDDVPAQQRFGCIVSVDVAEHIPAPEGWLRRLAHHLSPGGVLLLSTGCTDAWLWRLSRSRYWYAGFGEHLSFFGVESFRRFADAAGLIWQGAHRHAHAQTANRSPALLGQLAKYAVCQLSGPLWGQRAHPTLTAYADHQLVVLQRPTTGMDWR